MLIFLSWLAGITFSWCAPVRMNNGTNYWNDLVLLDSPWVFLLTLLFSPTTVFTALPYLKDPHGPLAIYFLRDYFLEHWGASGNLLKCYGEDLFWLGSGVYIYIYLKFASATSASFIIQLPTRYICLIIQYVICTDTLSFNKINFSFVYMVQGISGWPWVLLVCLS